MVLKGMDFIFIFSFIISMIVLNHSHRFHFIYKKYNHKFWAIFIFMVLLKYNDRSFPILKTLILLVIIGCSILYQIKKNSVSETKNINTKNTTEI